MPKQTRHKAMVEIACLRGEGISRVLEKGYFEATARILSLPGISLPTPKLLVELRVWNVSSL